jgi:molybdopterin synthase catalytic subunit
MASTDGRTIEEITFDHEADGEKVREQLAKEVLSATGIWATIAFVHRSLSQRDLEWKPAQITMVRFKRISGIWKKQSSFNINSREQLAKMTDFLARHKADLP